MDIEVAQLDDRGKPEEVKAWITTELTRPVVFQGKLTSWKVASGWSVEEICRSLGPEKRTSFKVCPKRGHPSFQELFKENEVIFETQCTHIEATYADFWDWMTSTSSKQPRCQPQDSEESLVEEESAKRVKLDTCDEQRPESANPLLSYPRSEYWIYADYKYMSELCDDREELLSAIDWGVFGFKGRGGKESTLWVGSEGAYTPCHYDTYGCNLIAQLWGRKRWVLFPPEDSERLYPTRVPYEESSVFSSVNVLYPDLVKYSKFSAATAYEVTLSPGEVLFVPRHWWHYVECLEPAVSVNTWIELPVDVQERVKEAVVRTMVSLYTESTQETAGLLNPNEVVFNTEQNLHLLSLAVVDRAKQLGQRPGQLTSTDFINVITDNAVVDCMARRLLDRCVGGLEDNN